MERVIKCRAWDKNENKFQYGSLIIEYDGTYKLSYWIPELIEEETNFWEPVNYCIEVDPKSAGQYIEKKDKNEKEIYDGDIISCWLTSPWDEEHIMEVIGIIEFLNGGWRFSTGCIEYNGYYEYDGKIIGNKFENPELFNKNQ